MPNVTPRPFLALFLPTLDGGGAERAFVELANQCALFLGVRVDLVCSKLKGPYVEEVSTAVRVIDLSTTSKLLTLARLIKYLRTEKPDALLSCPDLANVGAVFACALTGQIDKCFISERTVLTEFFVRFHPYRFIFLKPLFRIFYKRAKLIICNSYAAKKDLMTVLGVKGSTCKVIHNSVDIANVENLSKEKLVFTLGDDRNPTMLCAIGSFSPVKDRSTLVKAFALVRKKIPCYLFLLGEGEEREKLERLARALDVDKYILMPGFDTNPFRWLAKADVFISSSLIEGCPNVIQQALALGVRIVATDCPGGTAEILENGKWGRLVPMGDSRAMAEAIISTLSDKSLPDGRLRAIDFEPRRVARAYLKLIFPEFVPQEIACSD